VIASFDGGTSLDGMNRLADETSPYLQQHRDNPVDWYPWGEEAFERARAEDKPIMLSVGYSACHWCHVMAHESFEDPETAEVMNRLFVNIKVDREERPDVDAVYMNAVQSMTGRGGWPMTVFLTPEGQPFYGGTYFPKGDRHGLPGFTRILEAVDDAWHNRRDELLGQAEQLTTALARGNDLSGAAGAAGLEEKTLERAVATLESQFDTRSAGFGGAPKFPPAMTLDFLLRFHLRTGHPEALDMTVATLDAMAAGGMYDQLGGGFHRYSVDAFWLVPHFEKMLYDQATLLRAYLHGYLVTGEERFRIIVEEIAGYVLRDLAQPEGGFSSAEDADSEGEEGRFYVWSLAELAEVTGEDFPEVVRFWGASEPGNFEGGTNILHVREPGSIRPEAVERARVKLFARREGRVRPGLDDKVLTGWNAMFSSGLAEAAAVLRRDDWMDAARRNARFLLDELRRDDGRVLRSWQGRLPPGEAGRSRARHLGYAEDYAALLGLLVTLAEVDDIAWLAPAREVADGLRSLFLEDGGGAFFTTGNDAEELIARPRDVFDNATPSANSLAADALLRLAALTGDDALAAAGVGAMAAVGRLMGEHPTAFAELLGALGRHLGPPLEVAVIGEPGDPATAALAGEVRRRFLPTAVSLVAPPGAGAEESPLLAGRGLVKGRPTAYVCQHFACKTPVTDAAALAAQLDELTSPDPR
ncbi:MAG: thioredoxin domain-containing protein, partial [Acidimicrobiia bacterium]